MRLLSLLPSPGIANFCSDPVLGQDALKHQWLFLNSLDTIERVRTLVAFFVDEHNTKMPHAAFRGQTPDEVFFGTAPNLPVELDAARAKARELRLAANRSVSCGRCAPAAGSEIPP